MAKTEKKKNRKLRRRMRRTTAVIMLITSIIVAAIPVPENAAAPRDVVTDADGNITDIIRDASKYEYDVEAGTYDSANKVLQTANDYMLPNVLFPNMNLSQTGSDVAETVLNVDGNWVYQWQFKYYTKDTYVIISEYNGAYPAEEVKLGLNVPGAYEQISDATFTNYVDGLQANGGLVITLNSPTDPGYEFIKKYFPDKYEEYVKQYDQTDVSTHRCDFNMGDLGEAAYREYYCYEKKTSSTLDGNASRSLKGCTLVHVQKPVAGGTPEWVWIPKKLADEDNPYTGVADLLVDTNGFVCGKVGNPVYAIGNAAFTNVTNVKTLSLPSSLRYIGDQAFVGCSNMQKFEASNLEAVGNAAFKGCSALNTFTVQNPMKNIGAEAFYGTGLQEFNVTNSVAEIGPGAFAECQELTKLSFSPGPHTNSCIIDKFAFYNCPKLRDVSWGDNNNNVKSLGYAAFAMQAGGDSLEEFKFPEIKEEKDLGDYVLAGHSNLKKVTMPSVNFGRYTDVKLPSGLFMDCVSLEQVIFPDDGSYSCGSIRFDADLFYEVTNPDFYVRGPEQKRQNNAFSEADPRVSTWDALSIAHDGKTGIPYVYNRNGTDYFEICQNNMIMLIDGKGNLASCSFHPKVKTQADKDKLAGELVIPAEVAGTTVKTVAKGSFGDGNEPNDIKKYIKKLTFPDDGELATIEEGVFEGCPKLEKVVIGNTMKNIGANAFANCGTNIDAPSSVVLEVVFHSPKDGDYASFKIGQNAFTTGGEPLIFSGDIVKGYAPFEHAMDPGTKITEDGLRVDRKSVV